DDRAAVRYVVDYHGIGANPHPATDADRPEDLRPAAEVDIIAEDWALALVRADRYLVLQVDVSSAPNAGVDHDPVAVEDDDTVALLRPAADHTTCAAAVDLVKDHLQGHHPVPLRALH